MEAGDPPLEIFRKSRTKLRVFRFSQYSFYCYVLKNVQWYFEDKFLAVHQASHRCYLSNPVSNRRFIDVQLQSFAKPLHLSLPKPSRNLRLGIYNLSCMCIIYNWSAAPPSKSYCRAWFHDDPVPLHHWIEQQYEQWYEEKQKQTELLRNTLEFSNSQTLEFPHEVPSNLFINTFLQINVQYL